MKSKLLTFSLIAGVIATIVFGLLYLDLRKDVHDNELFVTLDMAKYRAAVSECRVNESMCYEAEYLGQRFDDALADQQKRRKRAGDYLKITIASGALLVIFGVWAKRRSRSSEEPAVS